MGDGQVKISWSAPTSNGTTVSGYSVTRATTVSGTYTNATGCSDLGVVLTCTATGLTNGTTYYFKVAASSAEGTGPYSSASLSAVPSEPMILTVDTSKVASNLFSLPLSGTVNVAVDWGDDSATQTTRSSGLLEHTYATDDIFTVKIYGALSQYGSSSLSPSNGSPLLTGVSSWGTLGLTSLNSAFYYAQNLTVVPSYIPANVTDLGYMFLGASSFNQNINLWDTSRVTNMTWMFHVALQFNQSLNLWNTSNVTNMSNMFWYAYAFNQNIDNWNVSNVTTMEKMFSRATSFNNGCASGVTTCPLNSWNTSKVTNMSWMFYISPFNQDVSSWNTSRLTYMRYMFEEARQFNQNIGGWDTSKVVSMEGVFQNANAFNQNIGGWNTSLVDSMHKMFRGAFVFNQNIGSWNTSKVTNMERMFESAYRFDQNIGDWNISSVTTFHLFLSSATDFSNANYSLLLSGWASHPVMPNLTFAVGTKKYSASSATARAVLTSSPNNWNITDGGQE
jgi:surface protein